MTRVIMFDYDGVIADSLEPFSAACIEAFREAGFPQYATRETVLAFHDQNWFASLMGAGIPEAIAHDIEDAVARACEGNPDIRPFEGIAEVIAALAQDNVLIVITASRARVVAAFLAAHGIGGITRVIGSDAETSKERRIDLTRVEYGAGPEYWYVGDTVGDILEGKAAGVRTIAVGWGWHSEEHLLEASPDRLARTPADLLDLLRRPTS
jgi:phosphoglycolate phosphatase